MVIQDKLYTVEEFESFLTQPKNRDRNFELIHGEIVEKTMPTEEHGIITVNISSPIKIYLKTHPIGRIGVEVRNRMPNDPHNSRQPDISFRADINKPVVKRGAVQQMPDLAVEIQSPDDSLKSMREKAEYYLENGARLVWLVLPAKKLIEVYTPDGVEILTQDDTLSGEDILPDFTLPVREVFEL